MNQREHNPWYSANVRFPALHRPSWRIIKCNQGDSLAEYTLRIDGMHCGSCIRRVTQVLNATEGVRVGEVQLGAARIEAPAESESVEHTIAALAQAGYSAHLEQ